ncbi:UNVERIFIED_CONTAM: hypothetical protein K2H54_074922 [Gekko kuhli]
MASVHHPDCISKRCCSFSHPMGLHATACSPLGAWSLDSPHVLLSNSAKEDFKEWHTEIDDLQRGIRVLARKKTDGYFYRGHIVQHVEGSKGHVLIEFERSKKSPKVKAEFRMQETPLYDVIHHEDGRWWPVAAGDRVLAPWEKKGRRYGPGTALQVTETGSSLSAFKNSEVLVNFWNGQTKAMPADTVVKIALPLSERIILELQMPIEARQMLVEQNPHYPYTVPPGYRASGSCRQNQLGCICWSDASQVPYVSTTRPSPHHVPLWHFCYPAWEHMRSPVTSTQPEDALIPGNNMTKEELNRKIEEQLSRGRLTVLEGNENEESRKPEEEKNVVDLTSWKESESNVTIPSKTHQKESASEDPRGGPGTMVDIAINTDKCTPWQEQKVTVTAASPDSPREAARIEFRRQKWEQRRLKEEQEQAEKHIQKELLRDTKRHRSLQRSLQGSQKQQENSEQAWQRLRRLQVAREEQRRQESCLREQEKNKESQRLEFLKAQRRHRDQQLTEHNQKVDAQESKRLELLKSRMLSVQKNLKVAGQEEDPREKKVAAKSRDFQKRDLISRHAEKKRQETQDLQQYLREQNLLMLRASLLS